MNNRFIRVVDFVEDQIIIECIKDNDIVMQFTTNHYECISVVTREWIKFGTEEDRLTDILESIL